MKKIILGIVIGLALSIGSISLASSQIKLIMVPETIQGYNTIDLLNYIATQKAQVDAIEYANTHPVLKPTIKNTTKSGMMITA